MKNSLLFCLLITFPVFLFIGSIKDDVLEKKKATDDYRKNLVATQISTPEELGWTGKEKSCKPGKLSHEMYVKAIARINYFRRLAGVNDNMVLDSSWNKYAQAAALIMFANNKLNHHPTSEMKCYTKDGEIGASTSNLSLVTDLSIQALIRDQIEDGGSTNNACGHRSWLLNSRAFKFGFGATPGSYAVRDFATSEEKDTSTFHGNVPEYFGYPFKGFVPFQVVYGKWSFSVTKEADFSSAVVEVKSGDKKVNCAIVSRGKKNYGDMTLVWTISGIKDEFYYSALDNEGNKYIYYNMNVKKKSFEELGLLNQKITVKISNVKVDGKMKSYTYFFTIFDPDEVK
ncbi:hypothetical protein BH09BAC5_BH09BAC5_21370 [soil metagenome]